MNTQEKIIKGRTGLILDHPFFGCLAMKLELIEDKKVRTAATDGKVLLFNPTYIKELSGSQIKGLLAHEVMHLAMGHQWRKGNREHIRWNEAGDYAINENLLNAGFVLPDGGLVDAKYRNLSAEQIYELLKEEEQKQQQGQQQQQEEKVIEDPGQCGAVLTPEEIEEGKAQWKAAVSQALQATAGKLPQALTRQLTDGLIENPISWQTLLRDFVELTARNDYNWTRPNRRYINQGLILPSILSEELPELCIAIDTSGSINEQQLTKFAKETSEVLQAYKTKITILYCDAKIQKEEEYATEDLPLNLKPVGGGGTDFRPVFQHIQQKGLYPACLIYFTDLYGVFPNKEPDFPVLWISTKKEIAYKKDAPFGKTIYFE